MNTPDFIFDTKKDSLKTEISMGDGKVIGDFIFISGATKEFPYHMLVSFYPTKETFFSCNIPEVCFFIENSWILFITNKQI